jgi:hypothetical protein
VNLNERFAGVWRLVSFEMVLPDGTVEHPYGADPVGRLIYDLDGRMSGQLMRRGRPSLLSEPITGPADEEIRAAFDGYIAYFGSYRVDAERGVVIHSVEASLYPNWVGGEQVREYDFAGNRLTLVARSGKPGARRVGRLVWELEAR